MSIWLETFEIELISGETFISNVQHFKSKLVKMNCSIHFTCLIFYYPNPVKSSVLIFHSTLCFFSCWMEFVLPVADSFDDPYQQDTWKIANYSTRFYFFCGCGRFFNFFDDFWHYIITCTMANSSTGDCFRGYESLCKITNQSSTQQWVTFTNVYWSAVFYLRLSKLISCLFVHEASWVFPRAQFHSNLQFKWYSNNQHSFRTARLTREKHAHTRLFVLRWKFQTMSKFSINVLLSLSFTRG